jgi:rhodanese-related sulfurtransferase
MANIQTISAAKLVSSERQQAVILDVRTDMEHNEKRLQSNHLHTPLDQLSPSEFINENGISADTAVYFLCRSGKRATQAAQKFIEYGHLNVLVIEGGIEACEACSHQLTGHLISVNSATNHRKINAPLSLERQVRIAAGAMTAIGALLALTVSPYFASMPLTIGSGLIFAGITNRCGLALLLTKAPWNQTYQQKPV